MKYSSTQSVISDFSPRTFSNVREDVNQVLRAHYDAQSLRGKNLSPDVSFLWQAAGHQNQAGGKRLRPYLCLLAYEAFGGKSYEKVVPVAAALELLHSAMLIHDDIIDRDYVRRNEPNVAGVYQTKYATILADAVEKDHYANAAALLAGDLLLSDAYQLVLKSAIDDASKIKVAELIGDAVFTVISGELLDSEAVLYPMHRADVLKIAELKTAQYSFATPLLAGAVLANASKETQATLQQFGTNVGIAFQLADDLLGVFGDETETGKSTLSDIREGKCTYLLQQAMRKASEQQKQQLSRIIGNAQCDEPMAAAARDILIATGAKTEVEERMGMYASKAEAILSQLDISDRYKQQFLEFIEQSVWRKR